MHLLLWAIFLLVATLIAVHAALSAGHNSTVYVIRHGEKKWSMGCLSETGQARADALPRIFNDDAFRIPSHLFANKYDNPIGCERCLQTLTPISKHLGDLAIDHSHGYPPWIGGNQGAATAMLQTLQSNPGAVLLVAWEHLNIQFLVEYLGVDKVLVPSWDGANYDSVYELTFQANHAGSPPAFQVGAENFNSSVPTTTVIPSLLRAGNIQDPAAKGAS